MLFFLSRFEEFVAFLLDITCFLFQPCLRLALRICLLFSLCSEAVQAVMHFEKNKVRPSAWKVNLTLGNDLALPCVAYAKAKEAKVKQSWKK